MAAEEEAQAVEIEEVKKKIRQLEVDTARDEAITFTFEQPSAEVATPLISSPEEYRAYQERRRTLARLLQKQKKRKGGVRSKPRRDQSSNEAYVTQCI